MASMCPFPRNGIGDEQVECHCHLLAKGDVTFQWVVSLVLGFPFPFPFLFPALTQVKHCEQVSSLGVLVGGMGMWSFQTESLACT